MKVKTTIKKRGGARKVSRMLGVGESTVHYWAKHDRLPKYAADKLGVAPRGVWKRDSKPHSDVKIYAPVEQVVHRSMWQRLIDWMMN